MPSASSRVNGVAYQDTITLNYEINFSAGQPATGVVNLSKQP